MINYALMLILPDAGRLYQADIALHILGGIAMAHSANHVLELAKRAKSVTLRSRVLKIFIIVGFVMIAAVLWEFYEFIWDEIFGTLYQPSKSDTMKDLFMGMVGGMFYCLIFIREKTRKQRSR
ncbi:MAG: hypothetical protein EXS55_03745 [Candidatus Magasanikbacteria bacterium]|nr:hypothetical protein [Candidatus Magasanikbacteria bacterium]